MADSLESTLGTIAEAYVHLALGIGLYDSDYVDAYYGPPEWKNAVDAEHPSLEQLREGALELLLQLRGIDPSAEAEIVRLRHQYLLKQTSALSVRIEMLQGRRLSFDEEAKGLYDATPPTFSEEHFQKLLTELETVVPGSGTVSERVEQFRRQFIIPPDRLDAVFRAAIDECRARTRTHIPLPSNERFVVEYVRNKSWSGYNWYKGDAYSIIQMNTDLPIFLERAVDLAGHEGYPGHHVYNLLIEGELVKKRRWVEFSLYAIFSPQSLISEGTANFGIEVAFPGTQRMEFERDVLFPLAGLNRADAERYALLQRLAAKLSYAGNEAARHYLNGEIDAQEAARWLSTYALMSPERAEQRTRFFDQYRSYVINYNLGQDLVKKFIESRGGTPDHPQRRWEEFAKLLATPRMPSSLA